MSIAIYKDQPTSESERFTSDERLRVELILAATQIKMWDLDERGGPSDLDRADVKEFQRIMADEPEAAASLIVDVGQPGLTTKMFSKMCQAIAVLSWHVGGITIFGWHFESKTGGGASGSND